MTTSNPVLLTRDDELRGDVLRLAAAAGTDLEVAPDLAAAHRSWHPAAAVLVGSDLAEQLAESLPTRRADVHVLCRRGAGTELFRAALSLGAASVLELPAADQRLVELLGDAGDAGRTGAGDGGSGGGSGVGLRDAPVLGVVGGSGGVGATTFACGLAMVAAQSGPTMLADLDPLGPGLQRVVGLDGAPGSTWSELAGSRGRLGARALRESLPGRGALGVLSWAGGRAEPPAESLLREVVEAGARGHRLVVLDLPRHLGEPASAALARCDHLLLVGGGSLPAVAAAARVAEEVRRHCDGLLVVARTGWALLDPEEVAAALGAPLIATLGHQRRLGEQVDLGLGPVRARRAAVRVAARRTLDELGLLDGRA